MSVHVSTWDPTADAPLEFRVHAPVDVAALIDDARRIWAGHDHGNPSLAFTRQDGSCLSIATDGARAFLVWTNTLEESSQSVGLHSEGPGLEYDYGGSFSEALAGDLVPLTDGIECVTAFLLTGAPDTRSVLFAAS